MSNGQWIRYKASTGAATGRYSGSFENLTMEQDELAIVATNDLTDPRQLYVDISQHPHVLKERVGLSLTADVNAQANGTDKVFLQNIPVGTFVRADLPEGQISNFVNDGEIEITSQLAGTGTITLYPPLHLQLTVEVSFT